MSGNFIVYLIGYTIAIIGVGYGLNAAGVGSEWILAVVLVMVGLGIVYALSRSQQDKEAEKSVEATRSAESSGQAGQSSGQAAQGSSQAAQSSGQAGQGSGQATGQNTG